MSTSLVSSLRLVSGRLGNVSNSAAAHTHLSYTRSVAAITERRNTGAAAVPPSRSGARRTKLRCISRNLKIALRVDPKVILRYSNTRATTGHLSRIHESRWQFRPGDLPAGWCGVLQQSDESGE